MRPTFSTLIAHIGVKDAHQWPIYTDSVGATLAPTRGRAAEMIFITYEV